MRKHQYFLLIISFLFITYSVNGQTKSATEFLKFSKQSFNLKSSQLNSKNWELLQPTSEKTDNGITTKMSFYGKEISNKEYYIILEFMKSSKTTTQIEKTQIKLPNGTEFDKWVAEFESLGYNFQKVSGEKGHLFAGKNRVMIKVGINNMNYAESEWSYEVSIIIDNK